jgi:PQQ-dependent dehydrogenase (methanol/ethanol family)
MFKGASCIAAALLSGLTTIACAQTSDFKPVTREMLANPAPSDWLMFNRTYDEQRFSPLKDINKANVSQLQLAWSRGMPTGTQETVPLVYQGVMYTVSPGAGVLALDATNGDLLWEYARDYPKDMTDFIGAPTAARSKGLALYDDLVFFDAPDGVLVALDVRTGKVRWEAKVQDYKQLTQHTSAPFVAEGKLITARTCETRAGCFIAAHDAKTGKELWKFYNTPAPDEPGGDTWGGLPVEQRIASSWGLPGSYDPARKVLYWAISNPKPWTRLKRHNSADTVPRSSPSELYSNSTVALDVETGKLVWYYQHLPGDDWDLDHIHERTLLRTIINPDPSAVKWINPKIPRDQERDIVVEVGEAGGIWALDRATGQFLWATPFPVDVPEFHLSGIDVETGRTHINWDKVKKKDGDRVLVCFHNTRSWWSTAYHPGNNSLYIPFHDACLDMTANQANPQGFGPRRAVIRPGSDPKAYLGIAKVNLSTGKVERIHTQPVPGNGSALVTAGDLLFWGDLNRRFRAFDADSGKILWETVLGGMIMASTITYAVNGRQYVAVMTGDGQSGTAGPLALTRNYVKPVRGHNAIYVFALPEKR